MTAMSTPVMISGITTYDNVRIIDAIVDEGETGVFVNSARLVDQVLRDARCYSTISTRIGGLLGKPMEFTAATPSDGRTKSTAEKSKEDLQTDWKVMFPHDQLVSLLEWGLMHNTGLAQVITDQEPWTIETWHPWALTWDEYERQYWIQTREESRLYILPDGKGGFRDENGGRWVLFTPFGFGNTRRNYLRCMHRLINERQWSHRDRARFSEIFALAIRMGIAPGDSSDEEVKEYKRRLSLRGAEAVLVVRQGEDGKGKKWGLELVQANCAGAEQFFNGTLTQLDREIATLFLGQSQTTDGQAGLGANEMAGEPVRLDMMSADNESLAGALRSQVIKPYWEFAYGNSDLAPWQCWRVAPPEDGAKKTLEFKQLMEGFVAARKAGVAVDVRATMEKFGYQMNEEQQVQIEAEIARRAAEQQDPADQSSTPAKTPADAGQE